MGDWQAESRCRLRKAMRVRGETAHSLAEKAGLSDCVVRRWANGKSMPNAYTARAVCEALRVSMDWVFCVPRWR